MIIDRQAFEQMIEHMLAERPREGVGVLAGPLITTCPRDTDGDGNCGQRHCPDCGGTGGTGRTCDRWAPLPNISDFPALRYAADDVELLATWLKLEEQGCRPWIMCHSHVRSNAAPSNLDITYAADETLLHLVVSLEAREPVAKLWRLNPGATGVDRVRKVLYEVVDLGFRTVGNSDLTRDVTGA